MRGDLSEVFAHEQWVAEVTSRGVSVAKVFSRRVKVIGLAETNDGPALLSLWDGSITKDDIRNESRFLKLRAIAGETVSRQELVVVDPQGGFVARVAESILLHDLSRGTTRAAPRPPPAGRLRQVPGILTASGEGFALAYADKDQVEVLREHASGIGVTRLPGALPVGFLSGGDFRVVTADWAPEEGTSAYLALISGQGSGSVLHKLAVRPEVFYSSLVVESQPETGRFWLVGRLPGTRTLLQRYGPTGRLEFEEVKEGMTPVPSFGGIALLDCETHMVLKVVISSASLRLAPLLNAGDAWPWVKRVTFLQTGTFVVGGRTR